jgi:hypothetical protein
MLSEKLQSEIDVLPDEASLAEACLALKQQRKKLLDEKIAGLSDYPVIEPVDGAGVPTEVSRERAAQSLRSGTHRLVHP